METLLSGGYIVQQIEENLIYDYLHSSEENLWSVLYLTGYLTTAQKSGMYKKTCQMVSMLCRFQMQKLREIFEINGKKMV